MANENLFYVVKKHDDAYHRHLALKELEALQKQVTELEKIVAKYRKLKPSLRIVIPDER